MEDKRSDREEGLRARSRGEREQSSKDWASDTSPRARLNLNLSLRQRVSSALSGSPLSKLGARIRSSGRSAFRRIRGAFHPGSYQELVEEGVPLDSPLDTKTRVLRWLNDLPDSVCSVPPEMYRSTRRSFSI